MIINVGGGPTDDKPEVVLEPPTDPTRTSAFLNLRVADMRDPDGHLIEVGQTTG